MTTRFDVVGIVVADMARSLAFYRQLGFDVPESADTEPHVEAGLAGGLRIAWDTVDTIRSFDPAWNSPSGGSRIGLAFACDDPADVDATYARLIASGHEGHLEPWDAFWGMRYAVLHDPDGNTIDLFAQLPVSGRDRSAAEHRQTHTGERPDVAREMGLVGVTRFGGNIGERGTRACQVDRPT